MKRLPRLTTTPLHHPDCCASLSSTLITKISRLLPPKPAFTISIGSGTGLLEALILQARPDIQLEAVEVPGPTLNGYLPEDNTHVVAGTWELCPRVREAAVWMFIYPREYSLVRKYVDEMITGGVEFIVWLGPRADFVALDQFLSSFCGTEELKGWGTSHYELLVVWRKMSENHGHQCAG